MSSASASDGVPLPEITHHRGGGVMPIGRAFSVAVCVGWTAPIVEIEADITSGLPSVHLGWPTRHRAAGGA